LAILPVRYTVVANTVAAELPSGLGNKVANVKLAHHKYALRTLRQGFVYVLHEKHPRGSQVKWEVYAVSPAGTLWKPKASAALEPINDEPSCSRSGHNIPASVISIEKPEKCAKVWLAFSEHAWSKETFKLYESDANARERRMQTFLPATWIQARGYPHGLEATKENVEKVIEYNPKFSPSTLVGKTLPPISKEDGLYIKDQLSIQTSRYPMHVRRGQSEAVCDVMAQIGMVDGKQKNAPLIIALWDSVGITRELNGYRNDAAGWVDLYGKERELEISALNIIEGVKVALEKRAVDSEQSRQKFIRSHHAIGNIADRRARAAALAEPRRSQELEVCDILEDWQAREIPWDYANKLDAAGRYPEADRTARIRSVQAEVDAFAARREQAGKNRVGERVSEAWPKYEEKFRPHAYQNFKANYDAFCASADAIIDQRTDDLLAWLESKYLVNALSEYSPSNLYDGESFEDAVGDMIFGINSSANGVKKIEAWVAEAKVTEENLLWRTIAANQEERKEDLNNALAAAMVTKDVPFTEAAFNSVKENLKYVAKFADLSKKSLGLHNSLRKAGIMQVPTGGLEKLFITVGDKFFQPFLKKSVDTLGQKFVQSLLFAKVGRDYGVIYKLLLAEARVGNLAREEMLFLMRAANSTVPKRFTPLSEAWKNLVENADVPKTNADPKLSGGFNEAKDLRFAMVATILQGLLVVKLWHDASKDKNNQKLKSELLAAGLSLGAALLDLAATAVKGLHSAKDLAISFQALKVAGGGLSAYAGWIATYNDMNAALKASSFQIGSLYFFKSLGNFVSASMSALATLSYAQPVFAMLVKKFPASIAARSASALLGRLLLWRALLMLGGLGFGIAVLALQLAIWYFTDDELQTWCEESPFGLRPKNPKLKPEVQMKNFEHALTEVSQ
jgi:hypothetical protein